MTSSGRGFPRAARVLRPADFTRVYGRRSSAAAGPIVVYAAPGAGGAVRLGLSVSRRIGNAVARNRWKRVLREAFREVRGELPAGNDFVIVVRSGTAPVGAESATMLRASLVSLARKITARSGYGQDRAGEDRTSGR